MILRQQMTQSTAEQQTHTQYQAHSALMKIRELLISLGLLLTVMIPAFASAQTVREMTLSEAIETAQKNSKSWAQFDAREESAKAQYKEVESHWWPVLSIDSTLMYWSDASKIDVVDKDELKKNVSEAVSNLDLSQSLSQLDPAYLMLLEGALPALKSVGASAIGQLSEPLMGAIPDSIQLKDQFTFTIGATLKMPLTPLFKVYQAEKLAQLGIDNVDVERRAKALAISYEVTEVYLKLVYAQLMNEVAEEALETIQKHVEMAQKYESVGMISHNDVLTAQVEQLKAKQNVVEARNSTRLASLKLSQVLALGRGVEIKALEMPHEAYHVELNSLESYQEQAISQRTEFERIDLGIQAAERKRKMAVLDMIPQVALIGSYQYGYGIDILKPSNQGLIGLMMSWTIFDGMEHRYKAQKASLEATELEGKSDEAKDLIELEVSSKYLALETAMERVELTQQALQLAEENLRTMTAQFEQGESVNTDVLTAQTKYAAARADDVKARIDILIAYAGLKLSLGENPTLEAGALN